MKTARTFAYTLFALFFSAFVLSCKKENNKQPSCRIVAATIVNGSTTTDVAITYNADKKISTMSMSGGSVLNKSFNYTGNAIMITSTSAGGSFDGRDSVTIDDKGRPVNIRHFYNQAGTSWFNTEYQYSGNDMTAFMQKYESDNVLDTYTVNSAGGNTVYFGNSGNSTSLEYYSDKTIQAGDYLEFESQIFYGVSLYPRKNLVKSLDSGVGNFVHLSYEFDAEGKITKVTEETAYGINTYAYQYQCD